MNEDVFQPEALNFEQKLDIRYLTPKNATFTPTAGGFVSLDVEGEHYDRVTVYRAFPFTQPDRYLSVRLPNRKGREVGMIDRLDVFDEATQAILNEQLVLRYFTPVIRKVFSVHDKHGFSTIDVETDRGRCKFSFRGGSDAVIRLSETRLVFTDLDGNRYEIPDVTVLSHREQKKLDVYL